MTRSRSNDAPARAKKVARALLLSLAFVLPFETPLFKLGPLVITSVELALYLTLIAWGVVVLGRLGERRRGRRPVVDVLGSLFSCGSRLSGWFWAPRWPRLPSATAWWLVVVFASALCASSYRSAALKFALRSSSGVLLFFAVRTLGGSRRFARNLTFALLAGALVSASSAVFESFVPRAGRLWTLFHEESFGDYGLRRASGVFAYPTMGAMYWEAAIPLVIVAPFLGPAGAVRARRRGTLIAVALSALLAEAILASATRSGLAGAAVGCVGVLVLGRRLDPALRSTAKGALGALVATSALAVALPNAGSLLAQRLRFWQDERWFGVAYEFAPAPNFVSGSERGSAKPSAPRFVTGGDYLETPMTLRNTGTLTWRHEGEQPTRLAYHWYFHDGDGAAPVLTDFDGQRTDLPDDVAPGGQVAVAAFAQAPAVPGTYSLEWDLVAEEVTWFSEHGNKAPEERVVVLPSDGKVHAGPTRLHRAQAHPPPPRRTTLWHAAVILFRGHPLLGVGPDNFRRLYGAVLPLAPTGQPYDDTRIHANNLYFETLADLGIFGIVALGAVVIALGRALYEHATPGRVAGLGFAISGALFFVHGASDYFLEFTPLYGLFWMTLGMTATRADARACLDPNQAPPGSPT